MSESSGGNHGVGDTAQQMRRNRNRDPARSRFTGRNEDLKDHVYDITIGRDTFLETTKAIAEYVGVKYDKAGEWRKGMVEQTLPSLVPPSAPSDTSNVANMELFKLELREHRDAVNSRKNNQGKVYALVLGQCSPALRNLMEASNKWQSIDDSSDVMALLALVQSSMNQRQTRKQTTHVVVDADSSVYSFKQGRRMSDAEYFKAFKDRYSTAKQLGGGVAEPFDQVVEELTRNGTNLANASDADVLKARSAVRDRYLAVLFITNSDPRRYKPLINDLVNQFTRGQDTYPTTLNAAYDYLINYKGKDSASQYEEGIAFYTEAEDHEPPSAGRGHANGRTGRGRGRTGRGGRGNNPNNRAAVGNTTGGAGRGSTGQTAENAPDHAQFLLDQAEQSRYNDNLEASSTYSACVSYCLQVVEQSQGSLNLLSLILLDSCSSICLVSNKELLHDIFQSDHMMHVQCNAGTRSTNMMGYLGDFPLPVWYDPHGIANILSLAQVKQHYSVQYSSQDDSFNVSRNDIDTVQFKPTRTGLYATPAANNIFSTRADRGWTLVTTVRGKRSQYSKRAYQDALRARKVQNIMMFPSTRTYADVADKGIIRNCPITREHVRIADEIFGPNIGALKGKTAARGPDRVHATVDPVPPSILASHQSVTIAIDILFVNKVPFFITTSRDIHFGTVQALQNRQVGSLKVALNAVIDTYQRRGFSITTVLGDPEFSSLDPLFPNIHFNICSAGEHVPDIERYIRTVKDRVRSAYSTLPFPRIPKMMLIRLVCNAVFWLNALPHSDGISDHLSPRYLLTGKHLDFKRHVKSEFGSFVQTHEEHTNDMASRTLGAICLGPTGNEQGGHYFMTLTGGQRIRRNHWTELPMPHDVISRVAALAALQHMPSTLTFADRYGTPHHDTDGDGSVLSFIDDDTTSEASTAASDTTDNYDEDEHQPNAFDAPHLDIAGVNENTPQAGPQNNYQHEDDPADAMDHPHNPADAMDDLHNNAGVDDQNVNDYQSDHEIAGVDAYDHQELAGVDHDNQSESSDDGSVNINQHMDQQYGPRQHEHYLRPRKLRDYSHLFATFQEPLGTLFTTEQMSLKKGLKTFGKQGADAVVEELKQVHQYKAIEPVPASEMTREMKLKALRYLMFLKRKRCGRIKARGCADGRKQRVYKTKEETTAPTATTEAVFITSAIDAHEQRCVVTVDIPGAFMHAHMNELIHVRLEGAMCDLLVRVDPSTYSQYVVRERGQNVIYVRLTKALYGTLQAALLFWENLSSFLVDELGFELNPYDKCVANKYINGQQCTVLWHVDDIKMSHRSQKVLDDLVDALAARYGQEKKLTVTRGKVHEYLGMTIDFREDRKVIFRMDDFVEGILAEAPHDMCGEAATPAANFLFDINSAAEKLDDERAETYHHLTAKLLYLCKRVRPDLMTAVAFLTTRVTQPDVDDWKKLARCVRYLRGSKGLPLTLEVADDGVVHWFVDASFAVHHDMRSHTGATLTLGKGSPYSMSTRQKLNTNSSTEAELVGVHDAMPIVLWTRNFLIAQGYGVRDNIVHQDNQSAILLEKNGRSSSGRRTRHIEIRYFFVTDRVKKGEVKINYCPTGKMVADFFTKPLQGSLFKKMRAIIMNLADDVPLPVTTKGTQECVGAMTYADAVRMGGRMVGEEECSAASETEHGGEDHASRPSRKTGFALPEVDEG